jgi:thioredoxin-dependent peroxiredoxin
MEIGQAMPQIKLPAIDGTQFDSNSLKGKKYLLTFFRFATCPFCNMRMSQLVQNKPELGEDFEIVAIFESEIEHLKKHANKHFAKFPILADHERKYYEIFGVKKSVIGMLKGMVFRLPIAIIAMFKGYLPHEVSSRYLTMPLSLLVDKQGVIQAIYHGKDEGDHMPLEQVVKFSKEND